MKIRIRQQLTIFIIIFLIIAPAFIYYSPTVKGDLSGPYNIYGYIDNSTNQDIPSGVTVTLTNTRNSNSLTTTTGAQGSYYKNVGLDSGMDCLDGDTIVVNCSYSNEVGENSTTIDEVGSTYSWCNLTGGTKLEPESLSISATPATWNQGNLYLGTSNATSATYFNLTNDGNIAINVRIHGENITYNGNTWYLNSSAGHNGFVFQYNKSQDSSWTNINVTNSTFVEDLRYNSQYFSYTYWQEFGLKLILPTSSTYDPPQLSVNITFWSIKA